MAGCSNKENCTCSATNCKRHGNCCQCVMYHRQRQEIPGCLFSADGERTLDRSLQNFFRDRRLL